MAKNSAAMCNTGQLNRRIQIQSQTSTQDGFGQPQRVWTNIYTCWANVDIQQSALTYSPGEFIDKNVLRITIRWTSSVVFAANQRILYTEATTGVAHVYEIKSVINPAQANVWLVLLCYEINPEE